MPRYVEDILEEEEKNNESFVSDWLWGVAQVAISKVCQAEDTFKEVMIASRTKSKCDDLKVALEGKTSVKLKLPKWMRTR